MPSNRRLKSQPLHVKLNPEGFRSLESAPVGHVARFMGWNGRKMSVDASRGSIVHKPPAAVVGKTFAIRTFSFAIRTFGHFPPDA